MELSTKEGKQIQQIDLTDTDYATPARAADRIYKQLNVLTVQGDSNLAGSLDDLLGAVYALILAKQRGFANRLDRPIEVAAVERRAGQMANGRVRTDGPWMAGFHFNSALFRTAAVYHGTLKIVARRLATRDDVPTLRVEVETLYRSWKKSERPSANTSNWSTAKSMT